MTQTATMIPAHDALSRVLEASDALAPQSIPLLQSVGLRLAENVRADRDYPPFDRAMMDGYAIHGTDRFGGAPLEVSGRIAAGESGTTDIQPGTCLEIMTGAVCPVGTEAIVPKELVVRERDSVTLPAAIRFQQHMALRGSECRQGDIVLRAGDLITPLAVGVLASVGRRDVRVVPWPRLGILTTGGELIDAEAVPGLAQIRDSNGPMLSAMAISCGLASAHRLHSRDDIATIVAALEQLWECDVIVLTGGVSTGRYDLVPDSLRQWGAEILFHKVSQKPGKPLLFARRGCQLLFGLPGNPLAAHLCFHRYVAAAVRRRCGHPAASPAQEVGVLREPVGCSGPRTCFMLGRAERVDDAARTWSVKPLPGYSSADLFGPNQANCYLEIPPGEALLGAGTTVNFEWLTCGAAPGLRRGQ